MKCRCPDFPIEHLSAVTADLLQVNHLSVSKGSEFETALPLTGTNRGLIHRLFIRLAVLCRAGAWFILSILGYLNIKPLFSSPKDSKSVLAFQAYSPHLAQFFKPVIQQLKRSADGIDIRFVILLHPQFSLRTAFELRRYVHSELGIPFENIDWYWEVKWKHFDMTLFPDVYASFSPRMGKSCLLSHGPCLQRRFFSRHPLRKSARDFDLMLVSGEYDLKLVSGLPSRHAPGRVLAVGLPYLDRLEHDTEPKEAYLCRMGLEPGKATVLLAPHWKRLADLGAEGVRQLDELVALLQPHDINVLVKLHACSFNPAMGGPVDWRKALDHFGRRSGVACDDGVDDLPALAHADILITDTSSRAFNFMLLGKPVLLYRPDQGGNDPLEQRRLELMSGGADVASDQGGVSAILGRYLEGDRKNRAASGVANACFSHVGSAARETVRQLQKELNTEPRGN